MEIGFVGAGKMGLPIAWNIAHNLGEAVLVYDPRPPVLPPEATNGAEILNFVSNLEALAGCGVVLLCLPDSKVVSAVVEGSESDRGLIEILAPESVIVDCSSSIPAETLRLSQLLDGRGIALHDAPVSGGLARAWKAELTVMAGGLDPASSLLSILNCFASRIVHLERTGDGHVMKAANNYLLAANIVSFVEALRFAREAGISFEKFGEVVNSSSGASYVSANKLETVKRDDGSVSFTSALIAKDIRNFMNSYRSQGLEMPLAPSVLAVWDDAIEVLGGEIDAMSVYHMTKPALR